MKYNILLISIFFVPKRAVSIDIFFLHRTSIPGVAVNRNTVPPWSEIFPLLYGCCWRFQPWTGCPIGARLYQSSLSPPSVVSWIWETINLPHHRVINTLLLYVEVRFSLLLFFSSNIICSCFLLVRAFSCYMVKFFCSSNITLLFFYGPADSNVLVDSDVFVSSCFSKWHPLWVVHQYYHQLGVQRLVVEKEVVFLHQICRIVAVTLGNFSVGLPTTCHIPPFSSTKHCHSQVFLICGFGRSLPFRIRWEVFFVVAITVSSSLASPGSFLMDLPYNYMADTLLSNISRYWGLEV